MGSEYITIAEFAKKAGVSRQSVYRQLTGRLSKYVNLVDNQKMIDPSALKDIYGIEVDNESQPKVDKLVNDSQPENLKIIELLQQELLNKDQQIAQLQQIIADNEKKHHEALMQAQKNLDQAQKLHAVALQRPMELEAKDTTDPDPEPRKSFWKRFFRK